MNLPLVKTNYIPALTGLRAVAAWMVFIHHFNPFAVERTPFLYHLTYAMHTGVSIFFVLSGMLIYHRYHRAGGTPALRDYFMRRFAKIYPLFFLLTVLTFAIHPPSSLFEAIANFTLVKGYFGELKFTGISQVWSLSVEETFYLLAPLLFLVVGPPSKNSNWAFVWKCTVVFGICLAIWCIGNLLAVVSVDHIPYGFLESWITYTFFGRAFEFGVGIMIAIALEGNGSRRKGQGQTWAGFAFLLIVLLAMAKFYRAEVLLNNFVLPCATGFLLLGLSSEKTMLARLLSSRPMQWLGKSSYAFYLIHIGVIQVALSEFISTNPIVLFILLNIVALGLYVAVERPLQRWILHRFQVPIFDVQQKDSVSE